MELKEIKALPLAPAVGAPFASSWSEDNKISVITEKGIYVVELVTDPNNTQQGLEVHRSYIPPDTYTPTSHCSIDCDSIIWKLNQQEVYEMVMDICLAPNLKNTKTVPAYVTQVAWSPAGMLQLERCLLASMTNYGSVVIQSVRGKHWFSVLDISSLWLEKCCANWKICDANNTREQFEALCTRVGMLRATAITWSTLKNSSGQKCAMLIIGLLNGDLLFWKINAVSNVKHEQAKATLLLQHETQMYRFTQLQWIPKSEDTGWLCVSEVSGKIKMFAVNWQDDEVCCNPLSELWSYDDKMQVKSLFQLSTDSSEITLIAVKGGFVIAIALDSKGSVVSTEPLLVENFSVAGAVAVDKESVLVVTREGLFNHILVLRKGNELRKVVQKLNSISVMKSAYYGISASQNKAIFCLVTSFNTMFDHLVQREPAQLTFFRCGHVDPYRSLMSNPSQKLTRHWDSMELIRLQGPPFPDVEKSQLEKLSIYELKIQMWLCKFAIMQGDIDEDEEEVEKLKALKERFHEIVQLILMHHALERMKKLLTQTSLTSLDRQSLYLMLSWLKRMHSDKNFPAVSEVLNQAAAVQDLPDKELCAVCQTECKEIENPVESKCILGHVLSRCCITMLQCAEVPYWSCSICKALAHNSLGTEESPLCVYCDSHLQLDERLLSSEEIMAMEEDTAISEPVSSTEADKSPENDKPTKPDTPAEPDKLTEPDKPAEPDKPIETGKPVESDKPSKPDKPTEPDKPTKPDKPAKPYKSTKPDRPAKPCKPNKPNKTTKPDKLAEPDKLTEPNKPAEPDKLTEPNKPAEPDKLTEPNKPAEPKLHKPSEPEKLTELNKLTEPELHKPSEPDKLTEPNKPAEPELHKPSEPDKLTEPNKPAELEVHKPSDMS